MDFRELVDANRAALYRFALSLTKSGDQAADLVQQTFYRWVAKGQELHFVLRNKTGFQLLLSLDLQAQKNVQEPRQTSYICSRLDCCFTHCQSFSCR
jgi:sigma-70-like protein